MIPHPTVSGNPLTVKDAGEDFLLVKHLANLSPRTTDWYEGTLSRLLADFLFRSLPQLSLSDIRDKLADAAAVSPDLPAYPVTAETTRGGGLFFIYPLLNAHYVIVNDFGEVRASGDSS